MAKQLNLILVHQKRIINLCIVQDVSKSYLKKSLDYVRAILNETTAMFGVLSVKKNTTKNTRKNGKPIIKKEDWIDKKPPNTKQSVKNGEIELSITKRINSIIKTGMLKTGLEYARTWTYGDRKTLISGMVMAERGEL